MSSDPSPIRILSVDDHPLIRQDIAGLVAESTVDRASATAHWRSAPEPTADSPTPSVGSAVATPAESPGVRSETSASRRT